VLKHSRRDPDIVAVDSADNPVLLVEVQNSMSSLDGARQQLEQCLASWELPDAFGMVADLETIQVLRWDGHRLSEPLATLDTVDVLRRYDEEFGLKRVSSEYLRVLVGAWLHDVAYAWKSDVPPAAAELERVGLRARLAGGRTLAEADLAA
jgi:hypothetical protein